MIQVYVPVRDRKRITIPAVVCKELDLEDRQWLRVTVIADGRALLERVPPEVPSIQMIRGAAALGATSGLDERQVRGAPAAGDAD